MWCYTGLMKKKSSLSPLDTAERQGTNIKTNRETQERLAAFDATGQFISGEKIDAWLARLEAGELTPPPEPECELSSRQDCK
jgi:hypothetical protein